MSKAMNPERLEDLRGDLHEVWAGLRDDFAVTADEATILEQAINDVVWQIERANRLRIERARHG